MAGGKRKPPVGPSKCRCNDSDDDDWNWDGVFDSDDEYSGPSDESSGSASMESDGEGFFYVKKDAIDSGEDDNDDDYPKCAIKKGLKQPRLKNPYEDDDDDEGSDGEEKDDDGDGDNGGDGDDGGGNNGLGDDGGAGGSYGAGGGGGPDCG